MPFRSEAQRRFMWSQHPDIAKKWAHGEHTTPQDGNRMPSKNGPDVRVAKRKSRRNSSRKSTR